ncbi:MAG TPA: exodeoxyribonuclease VII small subunit [Dictyobacter sp.]|jgi:exodeoxyribonuclease VII small subunit|nr:exodeoxyribonuclease VII small subunit [Dictyobacter sp.]
MREMNVDGLTFEDAYERLEGAIASLQDGKIPLDQALQRYQEGMQLTQYCNELLQKAELSVQQLQVDDTGESLIVAPLDLE